jgi:hypothetical protein
MKDSVQGTTTLETAIQQSWGNGVQLDCLHTGLLSALDTETTEPLEAIADKAGNAFSPF